jgi:hypothetical protein
MVNLELDPMNPEEEKLNKIVEIGMNIYTSLNKDAEKKNVKHVLT